MYELIIIGGGPAGITAGIYAARKKIKTVLLTSDFVGQVGLTGQIENWPGEASIKGAALIEQFTHHLNQYDIDTIEDDALSLTKNQNQFTVKTADDATITSHTILLATGRTTKKLNVPGEKEFTGKGVVYCTTCDAPVYQNKKVVVIGGGNTGFSSAIELTDYAREVTLLEAADTLQADEILQERAAEKGVDVITKQTVESINGHEYVSSLTLKGGKTLKTDGVFIEVGYNANSNLAPQTVKRNSQGEIVIDPHTCATSLQGLFAAGDVTNMRDKQIVTAAGEGAKAALSIYSYLRNL